MSVQAMGDVLENSPFSGATFLVHLLIADTVNEQNEYLYYASQDTLAKKCRLTTRSVRRAITELVDAGYLVVLKAGKYQTTTFKFVFHADVRPTADNLSYGTTVPTRRTSDPDTSDTMSTKPNRTQSKPKGRSDKSNAGDEVAKLWWESQDPKPAGRGAWHSLVSSCRAVADRGWEPDKILTALNRIGAVPSVAQLDRELRSPRAESWAERKAREEREEQARIEARRAREHAETQERIRRREEEERNAVPPPPEFREAVRRLRGGRSA